MKLLDEYIKVKGTRKETYKSPYRELEDFEKEIAMSFKEGVYYRNTLGFLPISVWIADWGKWRPLMKEYRDLLLSMDNSMATKKTGQTMAASYTGKVGGKNRIHTSFRNPAIDERVYKFYGKEGYVVRNIFHDYGIEYIIAAQMGMDYIGSTVNQSLIELNKKFLELHKHLIPEGRKIEIFMADATDLPDDDNSVDLIWSSPPYFGAEVYPSGHPHEMSQVSNYDEFLKLFQSCANEAYRILKPGRFAVIQVGDTREEGEYIFYAGDTYRLFKKAGFKMWDLIIMVNRSPYLHVSIGRSMRLKRSIMSHEYLFVFKKE